MTQDCVAMALCGVAMGLCVCWPWDMAMGLLGCLWLTMDLLDVAMAIGYGCGPMWL